MAQSGNVSRALFALGSVIDLELWSQFGGQAAVNRIRYEVTASVGLLVTYSDVLTEFAGIFPSLMRALLSVQATYRGLGIREINNPLKPAPAYDDQDTGVGDIAGDVLPSQVAGLLSFQTLFVGPALRGRIYLPFPSEGSNSSGGAPVAQYQTDLAILGTVAVAPLVVTNGASSITLTPVIWHRASQTTTRITTFRARGQWATQRRRAERSRPNTSPV